MAGSSIRRSSVSTMDLMEKGSELAANFLPSRNTPSFNLKLATKSVSSDKITGQHIAPPNNFKSFIELKPRSGCLLSPDTNMFPVARPAPSTICTFSILHEFLVSPIECVQIVDTQLQCWVTRSGHHLPASTRNRTVVAPTYCTILIPELGFQLHTMQGICRRAHQ